MIEFHNNMHLHPVVQLWGDGNNITIRIRNDELPSIITSISSNAAKSWS